MAVAAMDQVDEGLAERVASAIGILRQRYGARVQTGAAIRSQHGHTLTWIANQPPDVVVWPDNAA